MTVAFRAGESWDEADGAPMGTPIDVMIPSASVPDRAYRVCREHRGDGAGYIIHSPICPAWRRGHFLCRHVKRAVALADQPLETFIQDVFDAWAAGGWSPDNRGEFAAAMYRGAQDARLREGHRLSHARFLEGRPGRIERAYEDGLAMFGGDAA